MKDKTDVQEILLDRIDPFPDHPYRVADDEDMEQLTESIRAKGVLVPCIVRKMPHERFEMVSGHRRKHACERLGMETIPAVVKELTREEAIITMTDSNIQREHILPSEKAWAYKMKMDAIKHQGKTLGPVGLKWSATKISAENNESETQIKRYIRLTELIPELSQMVDEGKIAFRPAVELSYLNEKEQYELLATIEREDCTPSLAQSIKFKELSRDGKLDKIILSKILSQPKANQIEKIIFKRDELEKYFTKTQTVGDIKIKMMSLLEQDRKRKQSRDAR